MSELREKIQQLPHPGVVYDLAPYLTDINSIFALLLDYFRWLGVFQTNLQIRLMLIEIIKPFSCISESGVMANRSQAHLKRLLTCSFLLLLF